MTTDERADALAAVHDRLLEQVQRLTSSAAWTQMLQVASKFPTYSPNNLLLIAAQRPDATRVAGYRAWRQLGRQVRKGEHGIAILAPVLRRRDASLDAAVDELAGEAARDLPPRPSRVIVGYRVARVFDITQTDGPDLPDVRPALLDGVAPLGLWADLLDQIEAAGYTFEYADLSPANGLTNFTANVVQLRPDLSGAQKTKTLAHELAHIQLHSPGQRPEEITRDTAEVEAESVAYVVTAAHGLATDDYTVPYVTGWAGGNLDLIAATATRVLACAGQILRAAPPPAPPGTPTGPTARATARTVEAPLRPREPSMRALR
jgi:antirestriction protein ArdC